MKPTKGSAAKLRADRKYRESNRDLILYEKRVRYHQRDYDERTAAQRAAYRRRRSDPEKLYNDRQHAERINQLQKSRRDSKLTAILLQGFALAGVDDSSYIVEAPNGARYAEIWPLQDEVDRWIAAEEARRQDAGIQAFEKNFRRALARSLP